MCLLHLIILAPLTDQDRRARLLQQQQAAEAERRRQEQAEFTRQAEAAAAAAAEQERLRQQAAAEQERHRQEAAEQLRLQQAAAQARLDHERQSEEAREQEQRERERQRQLNEDARVGANVDNLVAGLTGGSGGPLSSLRRASTRSRTRRASSSTEGTASAVGTMDTSTPGERKRTLEHDTGEISGGGVDDNVAIIEYQGERKEEEVIEVGDCVICLSPIDRNDRPMIAPCKHLFHGDCLEQWMLQKMECPVCRSPLVRE